jgi:hypothetical protein
MGIHSIAVELDIFWDIGKIAILGACHHLNPFALNLRLLDGLGGPGTGIDIICGVAISQEIHRDQAKLQAGTTLHKKHVVTVVKFEQPLDAGNGVVDHIVKPFGAVAHLGDGHSRAAKIEQVGLDLFQDDQRQGGRACVEVENTLRFHRFTSMAR